MKRRVFLGLPVILGILFYIWYIFHASDNVAYSDYIRLVLGLEKVPRVGLFAH